MRGCLADSDAVKNGSARPINLVDPLAEPVAVVDDVEREVGPHVVRIIPHPARLQAIDFALEAESRCVEHRDGSWFEDTAPVPLISYPLELSIDPDLAHARDGGSPLCCCRQNVPLGTLVGVSGSDGCDNREHGGGRE